MSALNYTEIRGKRCRIMWSQRDPNVRRSGVGNVFVKNLPPTVDSKALAEIFGVMRPVASAKVVTDEAGVSRCYGYVTFFTDADAKNAVENIHGMEFGGLTLDVKPFVTKQARLKACVDRAWAGGAPRRAVRARATACPPPPPPSPRLASPPSAQRRVDQLLRQEHPQVLDGGAAARAV